MIRPLSERTDAEAHGFRPAGGASRDGVSPGARQSVPESNAAASFAASVASASTSRSAL